MTRVLVVDDQALVRKGFSMIIGSEPGLEVVGEAADGVEAAERCADLEPDVVLMDIRMPNLDGIAATRRILTESRSAEDAPRILILTTFDLDEYVYDALRAGASGFLLKDAPAEELVRAVEVVAAGDALIAPVITRRLIEQFADKLPGTDSDAAVDPTSATTSADSRSGRATGPALAGGSGDDDNPVSALTDREAEVLGQLALGRSNAKIAEALFVGETTVKTHVGRVLMKLNLRDRVQAVVFAYESGLVQPTDPAS